MADGGDSSAPLNSSGVDFSNETQAFNFLQEILDDTYLQIDGNHAATHFWFGIVVVIGLAAIWNLLWTIRLRERLRASHANQSQPARPSNPFTKSLATVTAIARKVTYIQMTPFKSAFWIRIPPLGSVLIIVAYLAFILALEFANNDVGGAQYYQAYSVRAAWLAVGQVPLIVLLAGKNNLIGLVSGVSYERLNVYHRWVARGLLLLATLHFGLGAYGWSVYGLRQLEFDTDTCVPTGLATYAILLWMNLSTLAPFRHLSYDLFVAQHIITFFGFIIAVMIHMPTTAIYSRVYIYIAVGLYVLDRTIRITRYIFHNIRPGRATLEALDGEVTRIRVSNCNIKKWAPGSHVLLAIPRYGIVQSHPATIVSTPSSHKGDLIFILKACKGFTRSILNAAVPQTSGEDLKQEVNTASQSAATHLALLDGPYGASHVNFACFDTIYLIAGGTGVTFALSVLLGLAERAASSQKLPVRVIRFVWVIKKKAWLSWIAQELRSALEKLRAGGIEAQIHIFVTCDDSPMEFPDPDSTAECRCEGICSCGGTKDKLNVVASSGERDTKLHSITPYVEMRPGRPDFNAIFWDTLCHAEGEAAVGVCGPLGLTTSVTSAVTKNSDLGAIHKGSGAQGIYLHVETFYY